MIYDITERKTYENIKNWIKYVREQTDTDCLMALVGNKQDICENNEENRKVSFEEATKFAEENNFLFNETSALNGLNINKVYEELVASIFH